MYTVEIYKADKRTKAGERLVAKKDYEHVSDFAQITDLATAWLALNKGSRYEIHETFVTRTSAYDGSEFTERYDVPYYCSPRSDTYWCS